MNMLRGYGNRANPLESGVFSPPSKNNGQYVLRRQRPSSQQKRWNNDIGLGLQGYDIENDVYPSGQAGDWNEQDFNKDERLYEADIRHRMGLGEQPSPQYSLRRPMPDATNWQAQNNQTRRNRMLMEEQRKMQAIQGGAPYRPPQEQLDQSARNFRQGNQSYGATMDPIEGRRVPANTEGSYRTFSGQPLQDSGESDSDYNSRTAMDTAKVFGRDGNLGVNEGVAKAMIEQEEGLPPAIRAKLRATRGRMQGGISKYVNEEEAKQMGEGQHWRSIPSLRGKVDSERIERHFRKMARQSGEEYNGPEDRDRVRGAYKGYKADQKEQRRDERRGGRNSGSFLRRGNVGDLTTSHHQDKDAAMNWASTPQATSYGLTPNMRVKQVQELFDNIKSQLTKEHQDEWLSYIEFLSKDEKFNPRKQGRVGRTVRSVGSLQRKLNKDRDSSRFPTPSQGS